MPRNDKDKIMTTLTIGLLPLSLELYDKVLGIEQTQTIRAFAGVVEGEYQARGIAVVAAPACRKRDEFQTAVERFEAADVDAIVTLHLAYSPSLEAIDALAETALPLIVLDTTPDAGFGFDCPSERILFNHGIHGVQDLCNMLIRRRKPFALEAGHWQKSDVIDRSLSVLRGYRAAKAIRRSRVGIVGEPFDGMGDFAVPFDVLKREIGMEVISASSEDVAKLMPPLDGTEVQAEIAQDLARFTKADYSVESLAASEAAGLGLRRWIERESLSAITLNFGDITGAPGLPVVPFLEASKAMTRGIGYGGEGDVLTAAFCGALAQVVPETTFTEMFCPDWEGERIFMSHMGEINLDLVAGTPLLEQRPYPFSPAGEPVVGSGCLKPGAAWLLNLAPGSDNTFTLVAASVEVCDSKGKEAMRNGIRGWIKPTLPVREFLKQYSLHGGTHHGVLCYGVEKQLATAFASAMGWSFALIG